MPKCRIHRVRVLCTFRIVALLYYTLLSINLLTKDNLLDGKYVNTFCSPLI